MKSEGITEINLMDALVFAVQYIKKKALYILFIPVIGCFLGYFAHTQDRGMYSSSMLFRSEKLKRTELTYLLKQLKSSPALDSLPLGKPTVDWSYEYTRESLVGISNYIKITLKSPDLRIYSLFEKAIVHYLEDSPIATQRKQELIAYSSSLIPVVDGELEKLEKWRETAEGETLVEIGKTIVDLQQRKIQYQQELEQNNVIVLVSDFGTPVKLGNSLKMNVLLGGVLGFGLLILVLFVQYFVAYFIATTKKLSI
jgi:hypothetical protein